MQFKKIGAALTALLMFSAMPCMSAFSAGAADADGYHDGIMNAVVYTNDNYQQIDCRYYDALPSIPYISLSDFYRLWSGKELTVESKDNGTYELTVPFGTKAAVDVENDSLIAVNRSFFIHQDNLIDDGAYGLLYRRVSSVDEVRLAGEDDTILLDFGSYEIDIQAEGDTIWVPIVTLCDLFTNSSNCAFYLYGTLFFRANPFAQDGISLATTKSFADYFSSQYLAGRPAELTVYNYNELCFNFDHIYGFPGRPYFTDLIREKGFDGFLLEGSDMTRRIREMLLSGDTGEYVLAIEMLNYLLGDGGHTAFSVSLETNDSIRSAVVAATSSLPEDLTGMVSPDAFSASKIMSANAVNEAREALYASADTMETLANAAVYCEKGDTAFFIFDSFMNDIEQWVSYYFENGALPDDLVSAFQQSVVRADQNPAIHNFVIDVAANTGGYSMIAEYMMALASGASKSYYLDAQTMTVSILNLLFDKNLDCVLDEADDGFKTDLRFGVLTSSNSFSCANLLPALARDNGVMVIGEQSGGGSCVMIPYLTADGVCYTLSVGSSVMVDKNYNSIDRGIQPDYTLFTENEDGTKDFSAAYDVEQLDACFNAFYGETPEEPAVTVTTDETAFPTVTTETETEISTEAFSDAETTDAVSEPMTTEETTSETTTEETTVSDDTTTEETTTEAVTTEEITTAETTTTEAVTTEEITTAETTTTEAVTTEEITTAETTTTEAVTTEEITTAEITATEAVTTEETTAAETTATEAVTTEETTAEATTTEEVISETTETAITTAETTEAPIETEVTETGEPMSALMLGRMARHDFRVKTGISSVISDVKDNGDGTYTIELSDGEGVNRNYYTVDAVTGIGTDYLGQEVNLPQTGNNAAGTAAAAAGAVVLVLAGVMLLAGSGVFRRKADHE